MIEWHDTSLKFLLVVLSGLRFSQCFYSSVKNNFSQQTANTLCSRNAVSRSRYIFSASRCRWGWRVYLLSENCTAARKDKYLIPCFTRNCFSPQRSPFRLMNHSTNYMQRVGKTQHHRKKLFVAHQH